MTYRKRLATAVAVAAAATGALAGTSAAAFPDFSDCPRSTPNLNACINVAAQRGFMDIKGFRVPLGDSMQIRGGLVFGATPEDTLFVAPRGTTGFFARPVQVPGGLIGIDFPIPGNAVTATAELAGPRRRSDSTSRRTGSRSRSSSS